MITPKNYNGWKLDTTRNPYYGFRYEKGDRAVIGQKSKRYYHVAIQELHDAYPTSVLRTQKIITRKKDAYEIAKTLMDKIDREGF